MSDLYEDLPEGGEEAFLVLEERFREDRDRKTGNFDPDQFFPADAYFEYMQRCASAAQEFQLDFAGGLRVPAVGNLGWDTFRIFQGDLNHYLTTLSIRRARRNRGFSVKFDATAKSKISHYITQIREMIARMELDDWKREALIYRLDALQEEIDRDRFRYQIFGAFVIEMGGIIGTAAERMEPARKLVDSIANVIWGTKQAEQTKSLPPPNPPKRIPAPAPRLERKGQGRQTAADDEIPF
jgi:hypothetical protein